MGLDMGGQAFSQSRGFIFLSPGVKISFMAKCFHCKGTIEVEGRPGRGERCPWCGWMGVKAKRAYGVPSSAP